MFLRHLFFVIAALFSSTVLSPAQGAPVFDSSDRIAIDEMYERYFNAFVAQDYKTLRECVQAPFVVMRGGAMQTLESVDAVTTFYQNQRQTLAQRGYDHSKLLRTQITPLTADSALINKSYTRYKKDGSTLEQGAAVYPVSKSSGMWKLRGVMGQNPQYFGKLLR